ncbi:MAG: hypothetical protein QX196_07580 [Methylococcaceae bacterium]
MSQIIEIAKMYNVITNKLKHSPVAVSLLDFHDMVELANEKEVRIRDCLKQLHKKGLVRKVPISQDSGRSRIGYEWVGRTPQSDAKIIQALITPKPIVKTEDDIRIKVNSDHSVTIITKAIRITIEVPT